MPTYKSGSKWPRAYLFRATIFLKIAFAAFLSIYITACSPLQALNAITPDGSAQAVKDVSYGSLPRQMLDIYKPAVVLNAAPVIVFFYGGNWNSGSRGDYAFVGQAMAARGIVALVADYRLYPEVRYPQFLEDSAAAVAWAVRNIVNYGGDPSRVFVMGHSAGAYNAAMVALDKRWLAAHNLTPNALKGWIGLAGPYDFLPTTNADAQPVFFHPNTPPQAQPIQHVMRGALPALLIAPEQDSVVNPVRNTGGLAKRLRQHDVPVEEAYFDRVNHASLTATFSGPLRSLAPTIDHVVRFVHGGSSTQSTVAR